MPENADLAEELRALADRWEAVLDECKASDPRWILDQGVMALGTALSEVRALLRAHEWRIPPVATEEADRA